MKMPVTNTMDVTKYIERAAAGDRAAVEVVVNVFQRQVKQIARIYENRLLATLTYDDLVQEGNIGVLRAINNVDVTRKGGYRTYFQKYIRGQILDAIRTSDRMVRIPVTGQSRLRELRQKELDILALDPKAKERRDFEENNRGGLKELRALENDMQLVVSLDCTPFNRPYGDLLVNRIVDNASQQDFDEVERRQLLEVFEQLLDKILTEEERQFMTVLLGGGGNYNKTASELGLSAYQVASRYRSIKAKVSSIKKVRQLNEDYRSISAPPIPFRKVRPDIDASYF